MLGMTGSAVLGLGILRDNSFRFVSVNNPRAAKDPESSRLARSHAVRQGLKAKRKLQEKSNVNFRVGIPTKNIQESRSIGLASLSPSTHDPFDMLVVDSWRLKSLLSYYTASRTAEPISRVQDDVVLETFQSVFRTDVDDPALSNAVMLTYAFDVTGGSINQECLGYLNKATKSISERMGSPNTAASVTVIGAILLLAGVEARLGMRPQVQLHMGAIRQLLSAGLELFHYDRGKSSLQPYNLCRASVEKRFLPDAYLRSIAWV
ncbi:hypothetical protein V494_06274 [Pseudogymnoascus sp. VKM F-4513 (FW-928)]|nr:hypothetical protein V494_06274 [Pseudogymnoascus sp. VKM F-4513 (FW-928)]